MDSAIPLQDDVAVALQRGGSVRLGPGSRATARLTSAGETAFSLGGGAFDIEAHGDQRQRVRLQAGPYEIVSRSAAFEAHWDPHTRVLSLAVRQGTLRVDSGRTAQSQQLGSGDAVTLSDREGRPGSGPTAPSIEPELTPPANSPVERPRLRTPPSAWRGLASRGKHAEAVAAARQEGLATILRSAEADDLLTLARSARYAREGKQAVRIFTSVRRRFPKSDASARAAYGLGRVAFDLQRDFDAAARWFQAYLDERPRGALVREALGRLVESDVRRGAAAAAKSHGSRYLDRYPDGPHADVARQAQ